LVRPASAARLVSEPTNTKKAHQMTAPKVPLNLFGIPFGLAGLGEVWTTTANYHHAPHLVGEIIMVTSAAVWIAVLGGYLRYLIAHRSALPGDLFDPIAAPFASLALITPMLLASDGLYPHAEATGRVLTDVFLVFTVLLGGWFTGQWIYGPVDLDRFHPGYFLPTVAGGLIGSAAAAAVGQHSLARSCSASGWCRGSSSDRSFSGVCCFVRCCPLPCSRPSRSRSRRRQWRAWPGSRSTAPRST
jgi:tellurite resistance protein TehA-like permease